MTTAACVAIRASRYLCICRRMEAVLAVGGHIIDMYPRSVYMYLRDQRPFLLSHCASYGSLALVIGERWLILMSLAET
jgi:hypothetical protein